MSRVMDELDIPLPKTRLNNSGWGRPPEQYRTPGIGAGIIIFLPALLKHWSRYSPDERVLDQLINLLSDGREAVPALASQRATIIRNLAKERGWLDGVIMTCSVAPYSSPQSYYSDHLQLDDTQTTLAVLAVACAHPPAVIWDAAPSWNMRQSGEVVSLRWVRRSLASPVAREAWESLQRSMEGVR